VRRLLVLLISAVVAVGGATVVPQTAESAVPGAVGRIVFMSHRHDSQGEIYTRAFSGGEWTRLTNNSWREQRPCWSPDGTTIAYSTAVSGTDDIWLMNADGTSKRNVTSDAAYNFDPSWSPDGTRIVYTAIAVIGAYKDVWVMKVDGTGKANLTPSTPSGTNEQPAWSPDGSKIAFTSNRDGASDIFVMNARGSGVTNLTRSATSTDEEATWSPDGSAIAFISDRSGASRDLYVMTTDGSDVRRLTTAMGAYQPAWSPDGRHILFSSSADGDPDLWMVDPDGSNLGHLTDSPDTEFAGDWESVNRPPVAVDDGPFYVRPGVTFAGPSVLVNDSDPDGESLTAKLVTGPSHAASFKFSMDGTFTYRHDGSAVLSDSFTYRAMDTRSGVSSTATVTVKIGVPHTVGLVDPGSGLWRLRDTAGVVTGFYYGVPGDYPFVGDWDCDGEDTVGLYRQSDGYAYLRNSNTQGVADVTFFFGDPGDVPIAGDFNGNGCDTLSIYRPSEARFYIINQLGQDGGGLGAADYSFLFGDAGDKPVVGDWDRDGIDEIGLHRESSGFFYYRNTLSTGIAHGQFYFGDPGDRFVAGDWGIVDGADTPGLFRPSNLVFYFRHDLTQGNADSQFTWTGAGSSWLPVAGDFNLG
jgi:Tol biopolymer transport system component